MNYMSRPHIEHYPTQMLVQNCALESFPERESLALLYSKCHFSNFHPHSRAIVPYGVFLPCALWLGIGPMVMLKGFSLRILMDALHREHNRKNIEEIHSSLWLLIWCRISAGILWMHFPLMSVHFYVEDVENGQLCSDLHVYTNVNVRITFSH